MSTKEVKTPGSRISIKQEDRKDTAKSRVDMLQASYSADPEKKIYKSNKENLDNSTKVISKNRLGTGSHPPEIRPPTISKKPNNQRSGSPSRNNDRLSTQNKMRFESMETEEETKFELKLLTHLPKDKEDGKSISQEMIVNNSRAQSSNKSHMKQPNIVDISGNFKDIPMVIQEEKAQYNQNHKMKLDKKNVGTPGNPWIGEGENTLVRKSSKSNLANGIVNHFQSPNNKDVKEKFKYDNAPTISLEKQMDKRRTSIDFKGKDNSQISKKSPIKSGNTALKSFSKVNNPVSNNNRKSAIIDNNEETKEDKYSSMGTNKASMVKDVKKTVNTNNKFDKNRIETIQFNNTNEEIESIEENLEYEINNNSMNLSGGIDASGAKSNKYDNKMDKSKKNSYTTKRSISEINNMVDDYNSLPQTRRNELEQFKIIENMIEDFTDSLDDPHPYKKPPSKINYNSLNGRPANQINDNSYYNKQNDSKDALLSTKNEVFSTKNNRDIVEKRKESVIEDQLNSIVNNIRPFSPPFLSTLMNMGDKFTTITRKNDETVVINNNPEEVKDSKNDSSIGSGKEDNMLEVIYDPVLDCYYHPKTNCYYELKE